mgnify:CR=1 FL=1
MNYFWIALIAFFAITFFISKKIFITLILFIIQYNSWTIFSDWIVSLKINYLVLVNYDKEISFLSIALLTYFYDYKFSLIIIALTLLVHVYHGEILDFSMMLDYVLKSGLILFFTSLFSSFTWYITIPYVISATKIIVILFYKLVLGYRLFTVYNLTEGFAVLIYIGLSNLFRILL